MILGVRSETEDGKIESDENHMSCQNRVALVGWVATAQPSPAEQAYNIPTLTLLLGEEDKALLLA